MHRVVYALARRPSSLVRRKYVCTRLRVAEDVLKFAYEMKKLLFVDGGGLRWWTENRDYDSVNQLAVNIGTFLTEMRPIPGDSHYVGSQRNVH